jgi:hypothetical protein
MTNLTDPTAAAYVAACAHLPVCPPYGAPDHDAAAVIAEHHDQGWIKLCNGVVVFDDTSEILPSGVLVAAHRPEPPHRGAVWGKAVPA